MNDQPGSLPSQARNQSTYFDEEVLTKSLKEAANRYHELLQRSRGAYGHKANVETEALHELSTTIEELNVTGEELRVQNQALRDAYVDVEKRRQHYEDLFTLIPDAYLVTDVYGTILEANNASEKLLGMSADRLRGKPLAVFIAEEHRRDFRRNLGDLRSADDRVEWTAMIVPRSGTPIRSTMRAARIRDQASHERLGWIIRDTTEKQRVVTLGQRFAEEQNARIEAERAGRRFRVLAEASRQLSSTTDIATICQGVAKAVVKYTGDHCEILLLEGTSLVSYARTNRAPKQAAFTEALRRRHNMAADSETSLLWTAMRTNEPQVSPPVNETNDATTRDLFAAVRATGPRNALALPLSSGGVPLGVMVIMGTSPVPQFGVEDLGVLLEIATRASLGISNAKLYNDLERANREKADFLAVLSHELRTPLSAVIGYSELLLSGIPEKLSADTREKVGRIRECSWHQLSVVEQILKYARIDSGDDVLSFEEVDIAGLVESVAELVNASANRGIRLALDLPPTLGLLRTDAGKVRQILINMLSNAFKFTDEGAVTLSVRRSDEAIFFTVSDTGIGIPNEDIDRIFDPFWRASNATLHPGRAAGMGLGLAVSGRLARTLGGEITVQSQVGVGTNFTLRLPVP
jgi:PAS domain S-box-containing protein